MSALLPQTHELYWPGNWAGFEKLYGKLPCELWCAESTGQSYNHVIRIHLPKSKYESGAEELKKVLASLPRGVPVQFHFTAPSRP